MDDATRTTEPPTSRVSAAPAPAPGNAANTSTEGDKVARLLGWLGTLAGTLGTIVAIVALVLNYGARRESQQLQLNALLDQAWDALGGSANTSFISDFSDADLERARRAIRDASAIRPTDPRVRLVLAVAHLAESDLKRAESELRLALQTSPDDYDLHLNLAVTLSMQEGGWSEAVEVFEDAKRLAPNATASFVGLGNLRRAQGRHGDAVSQYRAGIRLAPQDAELHAALGLTLLDQDEVADGIAALRTAVRLEPNRADFRFQLGQAYLKREGELQNAASELEEAVRLAPDGYPGAYVDLGVIRFTQKNYDQAELRLREAIRLNPNSAEAANNLGNLYIEKENLSEAIRLIRQSIELEPSQTRYFNLGNAYRHNGNITDAIGAYSQSTAMDPDFYPVRISLGRLLAQTGRIEQAVDQFRNAARIRPDSAEAHHDLAACGESHGQGSTGSI